MSIKSQMQMFVVQLVKDYCRNESTTASIYLSYDNEKAANTYAFAEK